MWEIQVFRKMAERFEEYMQFYVGKEVSLDVRDEDPYMDSNPVTAIIRTIEVIPGEYMISFPSMTWTCELKPYWQKHKYLNEDLAVTITGRVDWDMIGVTDIPYIIHTWFMRSSVQHGSSTYDQDDYRLELQLKLFKEEKVNEKTNAVLYALGPEADALTHEEVRQFFVPPVDAFQAFLKTKGVAVKEEVAEEFFEHSFA